jgi:uncharacterized Zn-binding protein involved in type VI secretion
MGRKMIGVGSPTSTGGRVTEGNIGINIDSSVNTSSIGHMATCPACSIGTGRIVAVGQRTINLPAGPVALEGDYVACGCPPLSNTVIAGQSTVFGGAEYTSAGAVPISTLEKTKCVEELYFSYGDSHILLNAISRFYVDLNIHAKTSGYAAGELVIININIGESLGRAVSAVVGPDGVAIISGAFTDDRIRMEGSL